MRTLFTIVIPNRNNEKYLNECLKSVIAQKNKNFIFIVSDNHSSDNSKDILSLYSEYITEIISPPKPLSYKDHILWILKQVRTDYVIFLAGDDIAHCNLIDFYTKALDIHPGCRPGFICSPFYYIDSNSEVYSGVRWNSIRWRKILNGIRNDMIDVFLKGPICNISSVAWNVDLLQPYVDIPDEVENSIDWYLYLVMSYKKDILLVNKKLLFYRVHNESTGNADVKKHSLDCKIMFQYLRETLFKGDGDCSKQIDRNIISFDDVIAGDGGIVRITALNKLLKKLRIYYYSFYKKCLDL